MPHRHLLFATASLMSLMFATGAWSQTVWYVDDDCSPPGSGTEGDPFCLIQAGIDAAQIGDVVLVADGTYAGAGNKELDFGGKDMEVRSIHGPDSCIIDCENDGRAFHIHSGETPAAAIVGFTMTNGYADYGGAVYCSGSSHPTIENCIISNNTANYGGGGFVLFDAESAINDCTFIGNTADNGDGGAVLGGFSGAVFSRCTFVGNTAEWNGGGACSTDGTMSFIRCSFLENSADLHGGGLCNSFTPPPLKGGNPAEPKADRLFAATLIDCRFLGNSAIQSGGGIYTAGGPTFSVDLTLINGLFVGNTAWDGGGIATIESNTTLTNCTLTRNAAHSAGGDGDGIYYESTVSDLFVRNSVLWNNGAEEIFGIGGGPIVVTYSDVTGGHAGVGNIDAAPLFARDPDPGPDGDWDGVDDDYGDLHIPPGSPCVDTGHNVFVTVPNDLDGYPRVVDGDHDGTPTVDMGAYELQPHPIPVASTWGLLVMLLLVLAAGSAIFMRRRGADAPVG